MQLRRSIAISPLYTDYFNKLFFNPRKKFFIGVELDHQEYMYVCFIPPSSLHDVFVRAHSQKPALAYTYSICGRVLKLCWNRIIFQYGQTDDTGSVIVDVFGINILASGHGKCESVLCEGTVHGHGRGLNAVRLSLFSSRITLSAASIPFRLFLCFCYGNCVLRHLICFVHTWVTGIP